ARGPLSGGCLDNTHHSRATSPHTSTTRWTLSPRTTESRVAGVLRGDLGDPALRPVDEVGGLPHDDVAAAVALDLVPAAARLVPHPQVGGDLVELVALRGADDERVAQAHLTARRDQHRFAVVERGVGERVVALAQREVDLLTVLEALPEEVGEQVALVVRVGGQRRDGGGEDAGHGARADGDARGERDLDGP